MDRESASHTEAHAYQKPKFYFPDCTSRTSTANRHPGKIFFAKANKGKGNTWTYLDNDNRIIFQDGILQQKLGKSFCALTS